MTDRAAARTPMASHEIVLALVISAVAFGLRIWGFGTLGVNHFDEGVYVFSALGLANDAEPFTLFPNQVRFAPPFFFSAASLVHAWTGMPADRAAILLNIVLGTLTVALVWWAARRWFGPTAGLAAAALLALNPSHIGLSRVALTDAAFSLFFLFAIVWLIRAVEEERLSHALMAGLATGLVWNTKYHGWFVLLITAAALVPTLWLARSRFGQLKKPLGRWAIAAAAGTALYVPWALYIRATDGYREIANYYLTLISTRWFANLWRHIEQQLFLEGPIGRAAVLVALAIVLAGATRTDRRVLIALPLAALAALFAGSFGVLSILSLAMVPVLLRSFGEYRSRVLLAWLGLWVIAAPLYHPYARLLLPFTVITCILGAAFMVRFVDRSADGGAPDSANRTGGADGTGRGRAPRAAIAAAALAAVLVALASTLFPPAGNPWRPARTMAEAAAGIAGHVPAGSPVLVIGEPPLAFYIHTSGRPAFGRVTLADLDSVRADTWFVTGVYADRAPNLERGIAERADRLTRIGSFPIDPNDLRLLDDMRPDAARAYRAAPDTTFDVTLYRVRMREATEHEE
ncbi:MAG: glycosyltransferase family 39 protein [Gemmatimonadetes bacterium]|nr:glycosyltransferase family 39 protein [Gemmatimonadota bacterium]